MKMSNQTYRLTALHQWVDQAIEREVKQRPLPDTLRLLRLRKFRAAIKKRLELLASTTLASA